MYLVTHVSWECQSQKWGDRAVHTSLSPAQWKCQFAAKSISSGEINPQSHYLHGNSPTSLLKGWCTDMGNTVWFKYMKICASLAVLWGIALPHLLYKCPHKIDRQMKKCQSSKVLLGMVMAPVKWNVKCVVVCHCVCSCQSLLNIAITAGSNHYIVEQMTDIKYWVVIALFHIVTYFCCSKFKNISSSVSGPKMALLIYTEMA